MLQRLHVYLPALECGNALCSSTSRSQSSDGWNPGCNRCAADGFFVEPGLKACGCIHDELNFLTLNKVDNVGAAFFDLVDTLHAHSRRLDHVGGACSRN